jgi:site-specific recombinase XerD
MTQTINESMIEFLGMIKRSRTKNTAISYAKGLSAFTQVLEKKSIAVNKTPVSELSEDFIPPFLDMLEQYSPATEQLYIAAVKRFFNFLSARRLSEINLPRMKEFILQQSRRPGVRLPQFPADNIERVLDFVANITEQVFEDEKEKLRALRDRAFLLTLTDTGLRVHEACALRRGDIDWNEGRAIIIGKGDKQAVVRFSSRSMRALRDYLAARSRLDGASNRPLTALPLFARHDKGAGKKVKPITTATGRNIVAERVRQALGEEAVGTITPHSFRHYFVTTVLRASGNLKLAQELARHSNIQVTQRYAHLSDDELDKGYYDIFEQKKGSGED